MIRIAGERPNRPDPLWARGFGAWNLELVCDLIFMIWIFAYEMIEADPVAPGSAP